MIERYPDIAAALAQRGELVCPIRGVSMLPLLEEDKDAVLLVPVLGKLHKYDIPLYQTMDGKQVLHRIIDVQENGYLVSGDNCISVEFVPFDAVIAKAKGCFKAGNYIPLTEKVNYKAGKAAARRRFWRRLRGKIGSILHRG